MSQTLKEQIIQSLIKSEKISQVDIDSAMQLQKRKGIGLEKALVEIGLIKEEDLLMLLVRELNVPFINLSKYKIDSSLKDLISEKVARQYNIIPLAALDDTMTVALSDPFDVFSIDDLKSITGKTIDIVMCTGSEIVKAIDAYYGSDGISNVSDITMGIGVEDFEIVSEKEDDGNEDSAMDDGGDKAPIIRMVNLLLKEAIKQRASDIHIEPASDGIRVRYRVDGVLHEVLNIPKENQNAILVRIKIMSRLDITTNHTPQDGRFKLNISGKEVDFRVSLLPTTFGQKVVMRILDKGNLSVGLDGLGLSEKALEVLTEAIRKPFGMVLITGPTGSGKSTTLYSIIKELNTVEKNIITVEDPVEYMVDGLTQIQARADIGLTFAAGLRAILRQSPDIVMVGEIRDNETGDIAIKASLTGQLVFSTLHTNDAAGSLTRLVDMGIEPFLVASSLVLVSAQRLCRRLCLKCRAEMVIDDEVRELAKFPFKAGDKIYKPVGCAQCKNSGYSGRTGVTEVLEVTEDVRTMLILGKSSDDIKKHAREVDGMKTLFEDAMRKCLEGITSLEEVLRVTSPD